MEPTNDPNRPADVKADSIQSAPNGAAPSGDGGVAPEGAAPPQLSLTGRILNNWLYVVLLVVIGALLWNGGIDFVLRAGMVVLGLGLIIFVHELGHFLAAKWCNVHVQTFSIGFGPAIPGCSFVKGETTYKISVLPLGGYVNMVGEGPEADEDESYPRSFKNKSVLQRMVIISAGVIMNMIFAAVLFAIVYLTVGERRQTAVIWRTDSGSPAWQKGVRPGWQVIELDGKKQPFYEDLQGKVALSQKDRKIPFTFEAVSDDKDLIPPAPTEPIDLIPHKDENNQAPVIGVQAASRLKLEAEWLLKKIHSLPVAYFSAAAAARSLDLKDGDVPFESTDPSDANKVTPLAGKNPWMELCQRLRKADPNGEFVVKVRDEARNEREVKAGPGFDFGDSIVATTNPQTPDRPFALAPFPPAVPDKEVAAVFDYRRRMLLLAGKPAVIQVQRDKSGATATLLVPPAYHVTFGLRMKMGKVAAVRDESAAAKAGVEVDDRITDDGKKVLLSYDGGDWQPLSGSPIDPVRLPDELYWFVHKDPKRDPSKWRVKLSVKRLVEHNPDAEVDLPPMAWDDSYKPGDEAPMNPASPLSIPQLGLAYRIDSLVVDVEDGSPAKKAGIEKGDEIRSVRSRLSGKTPSENDAEWTKWLEIKNKKPGGTYDQWAYVFHAVQRTDFKDVEVEVYRGGTKLDVKRLTAEPDATWPAADRGIERYLAGDTHKQTTSNPFEAIAMGLNKTWRTTLDIYSALTSLVSGRIDRGGMGGPVRIASGAFSAAQDPSVFLLLLAVISINLAVVNFLPIPVLDGGHMMFLIYEGVRGKPPPESVRVFATYLGLAIILALMIFVFYNDADNVGWLERFRGWGK